MMNRAAVMAAAAVFGVAMAFFPGAASAQTVKVGITLTYSGPNAALGEQIDNGIKLYEKLHKQELPKDVAIELIRRDDTGPNPDVAKQLAQQLLVRDQVQILTGGQWTPNAMAIGALSKEAKVPFVVMTAGGSAVTQASPYIVRVGWTVAQSSYPLGQWAAKHGIKSVYTVVSDFSGGIDAEQAFIKAFTDNGGTIIGSVRVPLATTDYLPFLQKVKDAAPDAVFNFNPGGPQATAYMKAFADLGIARSKIKIIGPCDITSDDQLASMGRAALGIVTMCHYSPAASRPANKEFVAEWKKAYGPDSTPTYFGLSGWDGMKVVYDAVIAQNGKIDPDRTIEIMRHWSNPNSPRGPIHIDPETRSVVQTEYLRRVEEVGGKLVNVEFDNVGEIADTGQAAKKASP